MSMAFARQLIERPGDETTSQLFRDRIDGVFWVDWREADDYIVKLVAGCIDGGGGGGHNELLPQWIDDKLHISFRSKLTLVPLEFKPGEQDLTLLALNRALAPDFEIRRIKASDGGDTVAFIVLPLADWTKLDAMDESSVDLAFGRIEPGSALFAHDSAPDLPDAGQTLAALISKGVALWKQGKPVEAMAAYDEADQRFGKGTDSVSRNLVCSGLFNKTLCLRALKRTDEEIATIDEIDRRFGEDTDPGVRECVISALRNKAFRLGERGQLPEQTALYDLVVKRYGSDEASAVRAHIALAQSGAAYSRMMTAKQHWADRAQRDALLRKAIRDLRSALEGCEAQWRVMVLGNLGYALFLAADKMAAARETQECLRLGGKAALEGQRSDAAVSRLAQVDAEYEAMLTRLWDMQSSQA